MQQCVHNRAGNPRFVFGRCFRVFNSMDAGERHSEYVGIDALDWRPGHAAGLDHAPLSLRERDHADFAAPRPDGCLRFLDSDRAGV